MSKIFKGLVDSLEGVQYSPTVKELFLLTIKSACETSLGRPMRKKDETLFSITTSEVNANIIYIWFKDVLIYGFNKSLVNLSFEEQYGVETNTIGAQKPPSLKGLISFIENKDGNK